MKRLTEFFRACGELLRMYQPVRYPGIKKNYQWALTVFIAFPIIFLWPILFTLRGLWREPSLTKLFGLFFSLFHLALAPLILAMYLVIPLLGYRIRMHHPADRALRELEARLKATQKADAG